MLIRRRMHFSLLCTGLTLTSCCDSPEPNPYEHKGPYAQLALADTHTCTLDTSGKLGCWKYGRLAEMQPPSGRFTQVSSGPYNACAVRIDGRIECWGLCTSGSCSAPSGAFTSVTVDGHACALQPSGAVTCWGHGTKSPSELFRQVDAGRDVVCGVTVDDRVVCWGLLRFTPMVPGVAPHPVSLAPPDSVQGFAVQVSVSRSHACAVLKSGALTCWGESATGQTAVPPGAYRSVVTAPDRTCALTRAGEVSCWGRPITWMHKTFAPPKGPFVELGLGDSHACARREDGTVVCWGVDQQSQVSGKRWMLVRN